MVTYSDTANFNSYYCLYLEFSKDMCAVFVLESLLCDKYKSIFLYQRIVTDFWTNT